jgi:protein-S-isoprenylcysteine O-methyltransferase Ste14
MILARRRTGRWTTCDGSVVSEEVNEMAASSDQHQQPEPIDSRRLIISTTSSLLIIALCLFLPAGRWAWSRGWLFLVVVVGASVASTMYLRRVNPDVIAGRVNRHEKPRRWDLLLGLLGFLPTMLAIPIVASLDDGRYHWSHLPWWGCLVGYALIIAGFWGVTWATSVNKFFEPLVRIQTDRGHRVIDTGPYAIIRHPGYAFGFLLFLGIPLALGSPWALIPAVLLCPLLVVRTVWEDRTLQAELPGYREYAQRVRYRLVPGVW